MNSANEQTKAWYEQLINQVQSDLPGQQLPWLQQTREQGETAFNELAFPHRKQEAWKYTSVDKLLKHQFQPASEPFTALTEADLENLWLPEVDSYKLVFANGRFVPDLSDTEGLPQNVRLGSLREAVEREPELVSQWFGNAADPDAHVFTALNTALINDGLMVYVPEGVELDRPVQIINLTVGLENEIVAQPRNLIVMGANSKATLIERFTSTGESVYFNNTLTEVLLQQNADLTHYRFQEESPKAFHLSSMFIQHQRDSRYNNMTYALGGSWARTDLDVDFQAEGGDCKLTGLYVVGESHLCDFHLNVKHNMPHCASQEDYKGILYGKGRAVFDGRIYVHKDAQQTDAHLSNKNLVLCRDAEVDTKPQLEIYADDVKCSHGTTVGQLDPLQVFYMRSRGMNAAEARKMLSMGFAGEILERCAIESLREQVEARVYARLEQAVEESAQSS